MDFKKLDPEIVFGMPMPESPKEIMDRIYQDEGKEQATDRIRGLRSLISKIAGAAESQNRSMIEDRKGTIAEDTILNIGAAQEKDISEECRKLEHDLVAGLDMMKQDSHQITL